MSSTRVTVTSPVTGVVWKIVADVGRTLQADQEILVIESMKMEIPVVAPGAGCLTKLFVREGDAVSEDQPLAELS